MRPASSVILFTVLSGAGFGLLALLGLGLGRVPAPGLAALLVWGLGYALATGGFAASAFHLGQPRRALLAFTQWRTSWLSREAWAGTLTLLVLAPTALAAIFGLQVPLLWRALGALACLATVLSTAMIYAQLRTVPRWNHWSTPALFALYALTGGGIMLGAKPAAVALCVLLAAAQLAAWRAGEGRFAARGASLAGATGLGGLGAVRSFAAPGDGETYVTREMIHVLARKHAAQLRHIALLCAALVPALLLAVAPEGPVTAAFATALHLGGALVARWLFFAEAEHVVGLYYGKG